MADIFLDRDTVNVVFGPIERIGALRGDLHIPVAQVRRAWVAEDPFEAVRGLRAPGTGIPGRIALGTWRSRHHGRSVVAAYRKRPALVLDLEHPSLARVVVSTGDAQRLAAALSA